MACEACSAKFGLFKRKKQCIECLRYFCLQCVIKKVDKMFNCDNCSLLSRRPLIRSQVAQMRSRDLRQYLLAKKVSVRGCVEKDDLISLVMLFANGSDNRCEETGQEATESRPENSMEEPRPEMSAPPAEPSLPPTSPSSSSSSPSANFVFVSSPSESNDLPHVDDAENDQQEKSSSQPTRANNVEIEELSGSDHSPNGGPQPVITEQDDSPVTEAVHPEHTETFTEIPVWSDNVKLSDINDSSELEYLSVRQLKNLLNTNRVDFKGCVERHELLDRALRLWEGYKQSRTDIENMDEEDLCKICWDAPIECVILECGHMTCCINCGKQMSECPICKQYVVRVIRFFKT